MPIELQAKPLQVLQDEKFERLVSSRTIQVQGTGDCWYQQRSGSGSPHAETVYPQAKKGLWVPFFALRATQGMQGSAPSLSTSVQFNRKRNFDGIPSATKTPRHQEYSEIYSFHIHKASNI